MKLLTVDWPPYGHLAEALNQAIEPVSIERATMPHSTSVAYGDRIGPFIALLHDDGSVPVAGFTAIGEFLDRRFPEIGLIGRGLLPRARVRAVTSMAAEILLCFSFSAIVRNTSPQEVWPPAPGPEGIVDHMAERLSALDAALAHPAERFVAGDRPTVADVALAAIWWTAEDCAKAELLRSHPAIAGWHERNCDAHPFRRASFQSASERVQ